MTDMPQIDMTHSQTMTMAEAVALSAARGTVVRLVATEARILALQTMAEDYEYDDVRDAMHGWACDNADWHVMLTELQMVDPSDDVDRQVARDTAASLMTGASIERMLTGRSF
jgi:molybdopterin biosynthesis enzyme